MSTPKTLTVIMADTYHTQMRIVHEQEWAPYRKRSVHIQLTEKQRKQLEPKVVGTGRGKDVHEEIIECFFEHSAALQEDRDE